MSTIFLILKTWISAGLSVQEPISIFSGWREQETTAARSLYKPQRRRRRTDCKLVRQWLPVKRLRRSCFLSNLNGIYALKEEQRATLTAFLCEKEVFTCVWQHRLSHQLEAPNWLKWKKTLTVMDRRLVQSPSKLCLRFSKKKFQWALLTWWICGINSVCEKCVFFPEV